METGRICEKFLCEACAASKRNGKCGLDSCEFRIIRSGLKPLDHLKHLKFKCPFVSPSIATSYAGFTFQGSCEAKLNFEGFCVHASEGCLSKGQRKISQNHTASISTDSSLDSYQGKPSNNNYELQSFESKSSLISTNLTVDRSWRENKEDSSNANAASSY